MKIKMIILVIALFTAVFMFCSCTNNEKGATPDSIAAGESETTVKGSISEDNAQSGEGEIVKSTDESSVSSGSKSSNSGSDADDNDVYLNEADRSGSSSNGSSDVSGSSGSSSKSSSGSSKSGGSSSAAADDIFSASEEYELPFIPAN